VPRGRSSPATRPLALAAPRALPALLRRVPATTANNRPLESETRAKRTSQ
jgi:hypothetical protein